MILATEKWSARTWVPGQSATQAWLVTGAANMDEARNAPGVSIANSTFVLDNTLRANPPTITSPDAPGTFLVAVTFAGPSGGGNYTIAELSAPPEYHPQTALVTEPVDLDVAGNPIVNAVGVPFSSPTNKRIPSCRYVYMRMESRFDGQRAIQYSGAVNSDNFTMPGFGTVLPGQAFCESITLQSGFTKTSRALKVIYTFELRADKFEARILNAGLHSYYKKSTGETRYLGPLFDANSNQISSPMRLLDSGIPYDLSLSGPAGQTLIAAPKKPSGAVFEATTFGTFVRYKLYKELPFSGLTLTE